MIDWFDLLAVQETLKSPLQHHDSKASIVWCSDFFMVQLSQSNMTTGKTINLTICNFVSKVMFLLFNTLSRLVIAFLPRSKCLLISWLQSLSVVISRWWVQPWNQKALVPWKKSYDQPRQHIKKQRHYFVNKGLSSQGYGFSSSHIWMWELDYKESWALKNWCFWTVMLKTLESPLNCKEIQPVNPKGNQT